MEGLNSIKLFGYEVQKIDKYSLHIESVAHTGLSWHRYARYIIKEDDIALLSFEITPLVSGCGNVLISRVYIVEKNYSSHKENVLAIVNRIFQIYKVDGCGVFTTTFGQGHIDKVNYELFIDLKFNIISEYPNYRHGANGAYKQRMLQLVI